MADLTAQEEFLKCIFHVIARAAVNPDQARAVVGEGKQLRAFNLCDGTRGLTEIAKAAKINQGNFSRTVTRWTTHGLIFKLGTGKEVRPLHLYPLSAPTGDGTPSRRSAPRRNTRRRGAKRK